MPGGYTLCLIKYSILLSVAALAVFSHVLPGEVVSKNKTIAGMKVEFKVNLPEHCKLRRPMAPTEVLVTEVFGPQMDPRVLRIIGESRATVWKLWWACADSNCRPLPCQGSALTN